MGSVSRIGHERSIGFLILTDRDEVIIDRIALPRAGRHELLDVRLSRSPFGKTAFGREFARL